jgi:hypothetical protein
MTARLNSASFPVCKVPDSPPLDAVADRMDRMNWTDRMGFSPKEVPVLFHPVHPVSAFEPWRFFSFRSQYQAIQMVIS